MITSPDLLIIPTGIPIPGGIEEGKANEAISKPKIVFDTISINFLIELINFSVDWITLRSLFNCFTNLFLREIILANSAWVGHVIWFCISEILGVPLAINLLTWVTPNPAIKVNIKGIKRLLTLIIEVVNFFWKKDDGEFIELVKLLIWLSVNKVESILSWSKLFWINWSWITPKLDLIVPSPKYGVKFWGVYPFKLTEILIFLSEVVFPLRINCPLIFEVVWFWSLVDILAPGIVLLGLVESTTVPSIEYSISVGEDKGVKLILFD